jgi:adenine-specific DNA-methyltransferase
MSIKYKENGKYAYEVHNVWDKDLKNRISKWDYIGKVDSDTGEIIPKSLTKYADYTKTDYLSKQIITYIGNKRKLLPYIYKTICNAKKALRKDLLITADLFSGSGIVSRLLKQNSCMIISNDLEHYSSIINSCYLSNPNEFDVDIFNNYSVKLNNFIQDNPCCGIISKTYAPQNDNNILAGERVFYTTENAIRIDTTRAFIDSIE